jgi:hypothetical protein
MQTGRLQALMIANGGLVLLLGMLCGLPFAFHLLGRIELWPIPWAATHSHARRAVAEGLDQAELDHVALLAITAMGWRGRVSTRRTTTRAVYRHRASSQRALAGGRHSVDTSLCAVPVLAAPG